MLKPQGGKTANVSGVQGESLISSMLEAKGYVKTANDHDLCPGQYAAQVKRFLSAYGTTFRADLVARKADGLDVIFEVKMQVSAGSVDEKLPFWLFTLEALESETVLCLLGGGQRSCAIQWCKENARRTKVLTTLDEVKRYVQKNL